MNYDETVFKEKANRRARKICWFLLSYYLLIMALIQAMVYILQRII